MHKSRILVQKDLVWKIKKGHVASSVVARQLFSLLLCQYLFTGFLQGMCMSHTTHPKQFLQMGTCRRVMFLGWKAYQISGCSWNGSAWCNPISVAHKTDKFHQCFPPCQFPWRMKLHILLRPGRTLVLHPGQPCTQYTNSPSKRNT